MQGSEQVGRIGELGREREAASAAGAARRRLNATLGFARGTAVDEEYGC